MSRPVWAQTAAHSRAGRSSLHSITSNLSLGCCRVYKGADHRKCRTLELVSHCTQPEEKEVTQRMRRFTEVQGQQAGWSRLQTQTGALSTPSLAPVREQACDNLGQRRKSQSRWLLRTMATQKGKLMREDQDPTSPIPQAHPGELGWQEVLSRLLPAPVPTQISKAHH